MKVTLSNFKCFVDDEFEFTDRVVLVTGPSGSGKSSLFAAVSFAMTGEGRQLVRYGARSCVVRVQLDDGWVVERSKGPCRLRVRDAMRTREFEDKAAQAIINDRYSNWELGYVRQAMAKSVVLATPSERAQFVQRLAFGAFDVDAVRKRCAALESARAIAVALARGELEFARRVRFGGDANAEASADDGDDDETDYQSDRALDVARMDALESEFTIARLAQAETEAEFRLYRSLNVDEPTRDSNDRVASVELEIAAADRRLRAADVAKRYRQLKQRLDSCEAQIDTLSDDDSMADALSLQSRANDMRRWHTVRAQLERDYDRTHAALAAATTVVDAVSIVMRCPACDVELGYSSVSDRKGRLTIVDADTIRATDEMIEANNDRLTKLRCEIHSLDRLKSEHDAFVASYPTVDDPARESVACKRRIENRELARELATKRATLLQSIADVVAECEEDDDVDVANDVPIDVVDVKRSRDAAVRHRERYRLLASIRDEATLVAETRHHEVVVADLGSKLRNVRRERDRRDAVVAKRAYNAAVASERERVDQLDRARRLAQMIKYAESRSMRSVVNAINERAKRYVDGFFAAADCNALDVRLVVDDEKRTIDVDVTHGGHDSVVGSLSGGELARVVLAFTIAVAELNDVNVLMLDEILAPLDFDTADRVIGVLRSTYAGRIVCVSHQAHKGAFDECVDLENGDPALVARVDASAIYTK